MNAMHRDLVKLVREKESRAWKERKGQKQRPGFHLTPVTGWLNDPNGLCFYKGEYHVFYQYSPFDENGGTKFWGHWKSKDLIEWHYLGTALYADQPYDCHGVYSGSALVEDDIMYLYYTGNVKYNGDYDYICNGRGSNTILAVSRDGSSFDEKECLMTNADYPADCTCHVRDPKVWKEQDTYYMVQGARRKGASRDGDMGEALIYYSADKRNWELYRRITSKQTFGYMWECPDYFELDGHYILAVSPQGVEKDGIRYQNLYQCGYFVCDGSLTGKGSPEEFYEYDFGFDFYAPQTFQDLKGRRIMIGWAGMPDADYWNPTASEEKWQHCLSLPRELTWENGRVYQKPVEELERLRRDGESTAVHGIYKKVRVSMYELILKASGDFEINIAENVTIRYDQESRLLQLELRGNAAAGRDNRSVCIEKMKELRLFVDTTVIEIFINGGEKTMTTRFYPDTKSHALTVKTQNGELEYWQLAPMDFYPEGI